MLGTAPLVKTPQAVRRSSRLPALVKLRGPATQNDWVASPNQMIRCRERLDAFVDVGLGYLTLGRPLSELSGGERQRVKLASRLTDNGRIFVFDEPTSGLHMADVRNLVALFHRIIDAGNTVIVIEHDLHVVQLADWVIDLGPEAGHDGGSIVFTGRPEDLTAAQDSLTGRYLAKELNRPHG